MAELIVEFAGEEHRVEDRLTFGRTADIEIPFDPRRDRIQKFWARTLLPDGTVLELGQDDLKLQSVAEPVWPATKTLPLPKNYPLFLRHVTSVTNEFTRVVKEHSPTSIGTQ